MDNCNMYTTDNRSVNMCAISMYHTTAVVNKIKALEPLCQAQLKLTKHQHFHATQWEQSDTWLFSLLSVPCLEIHDHTFNPNAYKLQWWQNGSYEMWLLCKYIQTIICRGNSHDQWWWEIIKALSFLQTLNFVLMNGDLCHKLATLHMNTVSLKWQAHKFKSSYSYQRNCLVFFMLESKILT